MILFTIGYEKLDQKQFMTYLSNHGVEVVADIRKLPVSRKKGFSKTALRQENSIMIRTGKMYRSFFSSTRSSWLTTLSFFAIAFSTSFESRCRIMTRLTIFGFTIPSDVPSFS
jgi:hypothetical protein